MIICLRMTLAAPFSSRQSASSTVTAICIVYTIAVAAPIATPKSALFVSLTNNAMTAGTMFIKTMPSSISWRV